MSKKLKVIVVSNNLELRLGGPPAVVTGINKRLNSEFDHHLVVFGKSEYSFQNSTIIPTVRNNHYGFFWGVIPRQIRKLITGADLIILHEIYLYSNLLILIIAKHKQIVFMPHGTFEIFQQQKSRIKKFLFDLIFKLISRKREIKYIVATDTEQVGVKAKYPKRQVFTVGIGVDAPKEISNRKFSNGNLLCLSRISEKKRIDVCIDALCLLKNMSANVYTLNIAGNGDKTLTSRLVNQSKKLSEPTSVHFLGLLDEDEKWRVIQDSSILLLPSMNENFAISVAECISAGVPVIVSRNVALHVFVEKYNCGIVIETVSDQDVARAVIEVERNFSYFVSNCIFASPLLDWESVSSSWVETILELTGQK